VRKTNGELISVTQVERKPLALGQKVLVIGGPQARIVPDYSVDIPVEKPAAATSEEKPKKPVEEAPIPSAILPPPEKPVLSDLPPPSPSRPHEGAATELPAALPVAPVAE